jgi:regulatory protein
MTPKIQPSAKNKVLELLARRDHSEKELREKLARRKYEKTEIDEAIESARVSNLLRDPEELARAVSDMLSRKKKSFRYIRAFLQKKGLPLVGSEPENEMQKARELLELKFRKGPPFTFEEKPKVMRYLTNRGFDFDTIRKVLHERE